MDSGEKLLAIWFVGGFALIGFVVLMDTIGKFACN